MAKSKPKITDVTSGVVDLLEPLDSSERQRVIQAAFMLLGETYTQKQGASKQGSDTGSSSNQDNDELPRQAQTWMRQNQISNEQLDEVFHIAKESVDIIVSAMPGKNDKEKTYNAYVLQGISALLLNGEASFDDKSARALCKTAGCFNTANHSTYMAEKGNILNGTKDKGWKLTAPGLKHGAEIVKTLTAK